MLFPWFEDRDLDSFHRSTPLFGEGLDVLASRDLVEDMRGEGELDYHTAVTLTVSIQKISGQMCVMDSR